jgi:lysophospholipase L1-like esterase
MSKSEVRLPVALWVVSALCLGTAWAQPSTPALAPAAPPAPPAIPAPPTPPAPPAPSAARAPIDPTPIIAFPGQYAPRPPGERFAVVPKSCYRIKAPEERMACDEFVLADWPRLGRYAAANAALSPPARGEKRVVFFGDSITDNWSKAGYGGFFPGKPYVNRGIGSQTTGQMLVRFRADVVAAQPRVVVILAGTNDVSGNNGPTTVEAIEGNLAGMTEIAQANRIAVVLASLLPTTDEKRAADGTPIVRSVERPPGEILALNRWIAQFARAKKAIYLDYHSALVDGEGRLRDTLTEDGLHPNAAGYALMAPLAEKAIAAALRR